jgi:hypothetical protein
MDKRTRTIVIIGCIVTFIIVPLGAIWIFSSLQPKTENVTKEDVSTLPDKTDKELLDAMVSNDPTLVTGGKPNIAIINVVKPEKGWYIVNVRQLDDIDGENPAKVLLQDTGTSSHSLSTLLGPGTDFPEETTQSLGIPDSVMKELNK